MKSQPLRERLGLSRAEWARVLNVNLRTVGRWETEDRDPGGTATAVMRGIDNALREGAELEIVKSRIALGIDTLVAATLSMTTRRARAR